MSIDNDLKDLLQAQKYEFYQSKYDYYKQMVFFVIVLSSIASFFYWFSDCMLYGRIATETFIARAMIFVFLPFYIVISKKCKKYNIGIIAAYIMVHLIILCTCCAVYYLDNRSHANEGLMIIECIFIFIGMAAPKKYSLIFHSVIILDIICANFYIHYKDFYTILLLHIIFIVGIELSIYYLDKTFKDKYESTIQLTNIVLHDQLTGAYNRNIFSTLCHKNTKMLNLPNAGILILDIDFFKKINDTYGHDVGDIVLQKLAGVVNNTIRDTDYLIRYGGEEFVVILTNIDQVILEDTGWRINKEIQKELVKYNVTVSIGGCMYDELNDYTSIIKLADEQLYYVKQHGRNSVKII